MPLRYHQQNDGAVNLQDRQMRRSRPSIQKPHRTRTGAQPSVGARVISHARSSAMNVISSTSLTGSFTSIGFRSLYSGAPKYGISCAASERKSHMRHARARISCACPRVVSNSVLATGELEAPHAPQLARQPTRARSHLIIYSGNMASTELVMQVCMLPMPWISV